MSEDIKNINEEEIEFEEPVKIILSLDDGTEETCEVISIYEVDGKSYIALMPENEKANEDEEVLYIYSYAEDEQGNPILDNIEDDAEYDKAVTALDELFKEENEE